MLSAERHFEVFRSLKDVSTLGNTRIPAADGIAQPGGHTPAVFAERSQRVSALNPGDTFFTLTDLVGVLAPIEWTILEKTTRSELLATGRGRYRVVSRGMLGATATVVLNVYEGQCSVLADLFVLVDEIVLNGGLQVSFEAAINSKIDAIIASARRRFRIFRDVTITPDTAN